MKEWSDIGKQLQESREKRRLSLEEVAHETRIPLATLESLEKNDYSGFASPAYTKSFLNQYSEFLKIDAHEILENFNTGNVLDQSDGIEYLDQKNSSAAHRPPSIRRGPAPSSPQTSSNISQALLILLITGGLIAGGVWGFIAVEKRLNTEPQPALAEAPNSDDTSEKKPPSPEAPAVVATPEEPQPENRPARTISPVNSAALASTPDEASEDEEDPDGPVYVFPEDTPPPRAIIVNEDEGEE